MNRYIKGKDNQVADSLSRPVLVIQRSQENILLGKMKEELRALQLEEDKWREIIEYLERGRVPRRNYPRSVLHHFIMWETVLYYCIHRKDGSKSYCLIVPQGLKARALGYAHAEIGHMGQKRLSPGLRSVSTGPT